MCIDHPLPTGISLPDRFPPPPPKTIINNNGTISTIAVVRQPLSVYENLRWTPGQNITVGFYKNQTTETVINKVKQYAQEWTQFVNIRFTFIDEVNQAMIRVGFKKDNTSWANIGRYALVVSQNEPTVNFGWLTDTTSEKEFKRVVRHEFGHVLGFIHEHQSPNAGINWKKDSVYAYYGRTQGWSRQQIDNNVFTKLSSVLTNSSAYDKSSIMHYPIPASITTDGFSVDWNTEFSATDKTFAAQAYATPPVTTVATNAFGILETGDDCDLISFSVEANRVANNANIGFKLEPGTMNNKKVTWWKEIKVPTIGGGYAILSMQDGSTAASVIPFNTIDVSRPILFSKAKFLGVPSLLSYSWPVMAALQTGQLVTLTWKRDTCN
jgi:hypothetical protein